MRNSRYFETAELMDDAFLALLQERPLELITVKDVCVRAGVSRSTFYLHYEGVADLIDESVRRMLDRFLEELGPDVPDTRAVFEDDDGQDPREGLLLVREEYLYPYLGFVRDNRRLFQVAVGNAGGLGLDRVYGRLERYVIEPILDRFGVAPADRHYLTRFHLGGIMAVLEEWVRGGCAEPIGHVARILRHCCTRGADRL